MKNDFDKAASERLPSPGSLSKTFMFADLAGHGALPGVEDALSSSIEKAAPAVSKKPDFNL